MYYSFEQEQYALTSSLKAYCPVQALQSQRSIIGKELVSGFSLWQIGERGRCWEQEGLFSVDEFNYCAGYLGDSCVCVDDLEIHDIGIPLEKIESSAKKISPWDLADASVETISGSNLASELNSTKSVICKSENNDLKISLKKKMFIQVLRISSKLKDYISFQISNNLFCHHHIQLQHYIYLIHFAKK